MVEQRMDRARLVRYAALKQENENRLARLWQLKQEAELSGASGGETRHSASGGKRLEQAVIRYMEYEERIKPQIEENRAEMVVVELAVAALPDPLDREILRLRYIDVDSYKPRNWKDVAERLYGDNDDRHVLAAYRLHDRAVARLIRASQEPKNV